LATEESGFSSFFFGFGSLTRGPTPVFLAPVSTAVPAEFPPFAVPEEETFFFCSFSAKAGTTAVDASTTGAAANANANQKTRAFLIITSPRSKITKAL
jgi:hypothetical protein